MANLFERLDEGRLQQSEGVIPQPRRAPTPAEKLQDWLVNHWAKPTVTAKEIYTWGPLPIRGAKMTVAVALTLVEQGLLVPIKVPRQKDHFIPGSGRHRTWEWRVVRANPLHSRHSELSS
jgi:hypothetical protein